MKKIIIIFILLMPLIPLSRVFELQGKVVNPPRPVLTVQNVKDGAFQEALDKDFSRHFGWYNPLVILDNTLNLWLGETGLNKNACVVVGNGGAYISPDEVALRDQKNFDWPALEAGTREMAQAIRKLEARGVRVLVLFVPSKLRYYPGIIPKRWRTSTDDTAAYPFVTDRMLGLMKEEGIPLLDTRETLDEVEKETGRKAIPPRGRHWGNLTSCQLLGRFDTPAFTCLPGRLEESKKNEQDIYRCLNAYQPFTPPELLPQPTLSGQKHSKLRNVLFVGSSFMRELEDQARRMNLFEDLHLYYYNKNDYQGEDAQPIPEGDEWKKFVLSRDLIVIDLYEVQLHLLDHGFSKRVNQEL